MDPDLELQGIIVNRLRADPAVTALVGQRIFDSVPKDAPYPFISYGPSQVISDDADCITGFIVAIQVDVWSRAVGYPEAKSIGDAVRACLHGQDEAMALASNALVVFEHRDTRNLRIPDGLTTHAALTFEASVERY